MARYCGFCGQPLSKDDVFCAACGKKSDFPPYSPAEVTYSFDETSKNICKKCGYPIPGGFRFCGSCGAPCTSFALPNCVVCGEQLAASASFCTNCGIEYRNDSDGYINLPQEKACPKCGTLIPDDSSFCGHCGTAVAAATVSKVVPACPKCHSKIHPKHLFCTDCGHFFNYTQDRVLPIEVDGYLTCPICGENKQALNRGCCWKCGIKFIRK